MPDKSFWEIAEMGEKLINAGQEVHFKWTCDGCGARCSFTEANTLFAQGICGDCGVTTNLMVKGCGMFTVIQLNKGNEIG